VRGQHLLDRSEGLAAKFTGDRIGARCVGIDNTNQANLTRLLQLLIDASVIAAKGADADDSYIDRGWLAQRLTPKRNEALLSQFKSTEKSTKRKLLFFIFVKASKKARAIEEYSICAD
jgi:hypothetical protein